MTVRGALASSTLVALAVAVLSVSTPRMSAQMPVDPVWSLAAAGDSIITRRIAVYDDPTFIGLIDIIRGADVAFTNIECQLFRIWDFKGYPSAENGGGYELGPPEAAADLKWAGFDIVSRANNHTTDYGIEGMIETGHTLDNVGLVHAGAGMTAGEAAQARYLETNKGRVALVSLATTFNAAERAGEARSEIKGRPGINALRVERRYQLAPADMRDFRRIAASMGATVPASAQDPVRFARLFFVPGAETRVLETLNPGDEDRILRSIRSGSRQADYLIATSHSHESGATPDDPPPFLVDFTHKAIDAGAQAYLVHGPHRVRGIEIYKGRPIFYSLADFIFQYETTEPQGADIYESFGIRDPRLLAGDLYEREHQGDAYGPDNSVWFESIVAVPVFRGHELIEMKIYPIELGHTAKPLTGDGRAQRGTPRLAQGEMARAIIDKVGRLSAKFGTTVEFKDGIGVWKPVGATRH
jgi:poly-gamma-glutamate capsule biosynthesis protein CapA/YwtB (metallophosphatase superfamily)